MPEIYCGSVGLEAFVGRCCDRHHKNHGSADLVASVNEAHKKGRERARSRSMKSMIVLAVRATSAHMDQIARLERVDRIRAHGSNKLI